MARNKDYSHQAFRILQTAFVLAPIIAGVDKFFNFLTVWSMYLSPLAIQLINFHVNPFMMVVGVIEIIAGIGVIFRPRVFSYVICAWLALIIANLLLKGMFFDIALRDFGLFLGALALGKLSQIYD